jgi:hypothetical protein
MKNHLPNYLFWEGLPFIIGIATQSACFCFARYREMYWYELVVDPSEKIISLDYSLVVIALLTLAALILYLLRRIWRPTAGPDRDYQIIFVSIPAVLLTVVACLLLVAQPSFLEFDSDGKWQEIQRNST